MALQGAKEKCKKLLSRMAASVNAFTTPQRWNVYHDQVIDRVHIFFPNTDALVEAFGRNFIREHDLEGGGELLIVIFVMTFGSGSSKNLKSTPVCYRYSD